MDDLITSVPEELQGILTEIVSLTDTFCERHLNEDYKQLCRKMVAMICQEGLPVRRGKPTGWASGVVHALGWVNFLSDPSATPHMPYEDVAKGFGVSMSNMAAKSRTIRDGLGLIPLHPDWCLAAMLEDNPLVWMLEVNGLLVDIRAAPREAQEQAFQQGLIPYIPADRCDP